MIQLMERLYVWKYPKIRQTYYQVKQDPVIIDNYFTQVDRFQTMMNQLLS